MTTTTTTAV